MNIYLNDLKPCILSHFAEDITFHNIGDNSYNSFYNSLKLYKETKEFSNFKNTIYIVNLNIISNFDSFFSNYNDNVNSLFIFFAGSSSLNTIKNNIIKNNFILIEKDYNAKESFLIIKNILEEINQYNINSQLIMNLLLDTDNLTDILDGSSNIFNNPIIVIDKSFKVIAHSNKEFIIDKYWIKSIEKGFCSYELISAINNIVDFQDGISHNEPFYMTCHKDSTEKLISKIFINNKEYGYVIVLDSISPVNLRNLPLTSFLSKIVAEQLIKKQNSNFYIELTKENLICNILDENISNSLDLKERMKLINYDFQLPFNLILIDIKDYSLKNNNSNSIVNFIQDLFKDSTTIFYDKYLITLVESKDLAIKINQFKIYLEHNKVIALISSPIYKLLDLREKYIYLIKNLELIHSIGLEGNLICTEKLRLLNLWTDLEKNNNLKNYCKPEILDIIHYDAKNNTDYFNTLKVFCYNEKNTVETAKSLFIHRNTVNYRLSKIEDIFNLNIEDFKEYFDVLISLDILNYLNITKDH